MIKKLKSAMQKSMAMTLALTTALGPSTLPAFAASKPANNAPSTATPIQHLVVIFQENVSFDHYFATYPNAMTLPGETKFKAKANTPSVTGIGQGLKERNQNSIQPFRLDPTQNYTCSQNHDYLPEQQAFDSGL